jgi:leader peptidase (prepilin peptidase)/N-methyltransferase
MILFTAFAFMFGACVGSFLNVVILRIPREESLWRQSSHCFSCNTPIPFYHNIPLVSFLLLRGKCSHCRTRYSSQYFFVELLTALCFAGTFYYRFTYIVPYLMNGSLPEWALLQSSLVPWLADIVLLSSLIAMIWIDARHFIIPLEITVTGFLVGFALCMWYPQLRGPEVITRWMALGQIGLAFIAGGGLLLLVRWLGGIYFKREALGMGDVHLMFMLAMFLNWPQILLVIFLSALVGSIGGISAKLIMRKTHWRFEIPYGPYLAVGAVVAYFWGNQLIQWYLNCFVL